MIDSFLRNEKVCTPTKADGLAGTEQKILKTEEGHLLHSSSAEADGKDNERGSGESPECTKSHEKPSTSMVKVTKKGEMLNSCFCPVTSTSRRLWWALCITLVLRVVLICTGMV